MTLRPVRPRRSLLYVPASNPRALAKAQTLPADGVIVDLEDSIAPDAKDAARREAVAVAAEAWGERELLLRVNGLDTPWGHADLAAAAHAGFDGVVLPKVEGADTVRRALAVLDGAGASETLPLWCMLETPMGVLNVREIAAASPRVAGLVMGTSDLVKDLHAAHTASRLPIVTALGLCLLAARAYGIAVIDGVYLDLHDAEGFAASCRQGAELGFDGKSLIHPSQIAPANEAFAPDPEALGSARRIIQAHAEAVAAGRGVTVVDGRLVESLHVAEARRLVALHDAIAARGTPA
jgi:citrate lyase subunit beta/citryl-CoA lyase